jgi:RNA polymerase sigma-70 factor (ECF subfamily)
VAAVDEATQTTFVALVNRHAGILRKVAGTYARNAADRHDLIQEITLHLWKAFPRYDPARPFTTWMYRIALNVGISFLRGAGNPVKQTQSIDALGLDPVDATAMVPGSDDEDEHLVVLRRFIEQLEPINRALLLLYLDEQSHRDIADVLGITETNVATKIGRLKERLRQYVPPAPVAANHRRTGDDRGTR